MGCTTWDSRVDLLDRSSGTQRRAQQAVTFQHKLEKNPERFLLLKFCGEMSLISICYDSPFDHNE